MTTNIGRYWHVGMIVRSKATYLVFDRSQTIQYLRLYGGESTKKNSPVVDNLQNTACPISILSIVCQQQYIKDVSLKSPPCISIVLLECNLYELFMALL